MVKDNKKISKEALMISKQLIFHIIRAVFLFIYIMLLFHEYNKYIVVPISLVLCFLSIFLNIDDDTEDYIGG